MIASRPSGPRVVVVTGAARGIGRAIAERFAAAGEHVLLVDVDPRLEGIEGVNGIDHEVVVADVADVGAARAVVTRALERFGRLDILINNAAVHEGLGPIDTVSDDVWDYVLATNMRSVFLMSKFALPALARTRGTIVNLASIVGPVIGTPVSLPYGTSKAAIVGFTRSLALQAAPLGVRVNCVCPGPVDTDLTRRSFAALAAQRGSDPEGAMSAFAEDIPLGRFALPDEIAGVVRFLASADASYLTGAMIVVDGGLSVR